jgi:hypothetical protein
MLSWFQRKPSTGPAHPAKNPANPGVGVKASVAPARADESCPEAVDAVRLAGRALSQRLATGRIRVSETVCRDS